MEKQNELPSATWRLLNSGFSDGATNMAIDEALMLSIGEKRSLPTLRFYGWQPPCVSVGYAQPLQGEIDLELCKSKGYTFTRRPTGGRAVLHIDELTYSVVAPVGEARVAGDILTSYRRISQGLVAGLRSLGCNVTQAGPLLHKGSKEMSYACFDVPSHYEVTALGRKLVGSAQLRRKGVVLQHGALPLKGDVSRLADVLALPEQHRLKVRRKLSQRAIALDQALGRIAMYDEVVEALLEGFARTLNLELKPGVLSTEEQVAVTRLKFRYSGDEWSFKI